MQHVQSARVPYNITPSFLFSPDTDTSSSYYQSAAFLLASPPVLSVSRQIPASEGCSVFQQLAVEQDWSFILCIQIAARTAQL